MAFLLWEMIMKHWVLFVSSGILQHSTGYGWYESPLGVGQIFWSQTSKHLVYLGEVCLVTHVWIDILDEQINTYIYTYKYICKHLCK